MEEQKGALSACAPFPCPREVHSAPQDQGVKPELEAAPHNAWIEFLSHDLIPGVRLTVRTRLGQGVPG